MVGWGTGKLYHYFSAYNCSETAKHWKMKLMGGDLFGWESNHWPDGK